VEQAQNAAKVIPVNVARKSIDIAPWTRFRISAHLCCKSSAITESLSQVVASNDGEGDSGMVRPGQASGLREVLGVLMLVA
jgi:hypothetical protein